MFKLFGTCLDPAHVRNILVITLSNLGDVILTTPVMALLRERFPEAKLSVVVGPKGVELLNTSTTIDEVIPFDKRSSFFEKVRLIARLRKHTFDLVVDLRNTMIPWMIKSRVRTPIQIDRRSISMRARHLDRVRSLMPVGPIQSRFHFFSESEQTSAFQKIRECLSDWNEDRFAVLAPGAGSDLKRWTLSGFGTVMDRLRAQNVSIVLVGDARERRLGEELLRNGAKPAANMIGELTVREVAGAIAKAMLVVANDSAVMHLSHELGRRTISIFGPTSEHKYGKTDLSSRSVRLALECAPCEQAQCRLPYRACLDDLDASVVLNAYHELMEHEHD
ncbi:MAG: hypothetical protein A3A73_03620 [Omnitrophica bacterium RIFCSPLOWO2_01_FULL_50_24]|nr:MAG: hypothetical protein A3A73_03620 [Omnitrophica bacterium RIFCSPLOWO2_01_FULL_50_24]